MAAHFPRDVPLVHAYCFIPKKHVTHLIPHTHFPIPVLVWISPTPPVSLFVVLVGFVNAHCCGLFPQALERSVIHYRICVSKLGRLQSRSSRLNNNVFPKHLLECSKTFHSQRLAATHRDLLIHTLTWELPGADAVACLNNIQLSAMLNFISECFDNDVQY